MSMRGWKQCGLATWCAVAVFSGLSAAAQAPTLPPGLGPEPAAAPALPPGLAPEPARMPALPPGLNGGTDDSGGAPPLPEGLSGEPPADGEETGIEKEPFLTLHGFWDTRAGMRYRDDPAQSKDLTLGESRLQLKTEKHWGAVSLDTAADTYFDAVDEEGHFDLRQLRLSWTPVDSVDVKIGRQVLTWGTGDMLFINDLFPKDWNSFFIGRDVEYLKAPSDAVRLGYYSDAVNVELVYTPRFNPDRYITGDRISFYNPMYGRTVGRDHEMGMREPDDWFDSDEWALRVYRNFGSTQVALYGYSGYWKSPGGQQLLPPRGLFPALNVYGASVRGTVGKGVASAEVGWYDSRRDRAGRDPFVNNSELRLLLGYEREVAKELTAGVQYYLEHMLDHADYARSLWFFLPERDENRHVFTLRLTKLLMNQNLTLSFFGYFSPSDNDGYLRPQVAYKLSDDWSVDAGGNIFLGAWDTTFFGQFEDNSNVYAGMRWSF